MFEPRHDPGALRGALSWVDARFGLIPRLEHTSHVAPEPAWHVYDAELARIPAGRMYAPEPEIAAGASLDPDEALRRALGEAIERYCGLHAPPPERLFAMPWRESSLAARFPRCAADEPCPESLRGEPTSALVPHTTVRQLTDDRELPVPAAHVYPAAPRVKGEPLLALGISTGLAFHLDLVRALWAGLCEVAERDAVMSMWWTRARVPRIDVSNAPEPLRDRVARLREVGIEAHLFDVTTDFAVPTVFCVLLAPDYPRVLTGASCASEPLRACTKAIDETIGVRHYARQETEPASADDVDAPFEHRFDGVRSLADHVRLYGTRGPSPALDFLLREPPSIEFHTFAAAAYWDEPTSMAELRARAQQLDAQGLTVLWADLTLPEAEPLGRVVRVVVPEMLPLSPDHRIRWLATPRLARRIGVEAPSVSAFNPWPHPFA